MGSAIWMMELATNTITAESRIGNHNAWMGTISLLVEHGTKWNISAQPTRENASGQRDFLRCLLFEQLLLGPCCCFSNHWIWVVRSAFGGGYERFVSTVADCD